MKIELLMRSLVQEFSDNNNYEKQESAQWSDRYSDYWPSNAPYYDTYTLSQPRSTAVCQEKILSFLKIRRESFGGVLFDMLSKAVFKLDDSAYQAMSLLISGITISDLPKHINIHDKDICILKTSLNNLGICKI